LHVGAACLDCHCPACPALPALLPPALHACQPCNSRCSLPLQEQGVGVFFASFKWWEQQEQPGPYDFRLMDYVQQTVCVGGMKLAVLLEAHYTPPWVFERFPDAAQVDAKNNTMKEISFNHAGAMHLLHSWHEAALAQLASINASCIHSVQPTFNNEVETKYTQVRWMPACCPPVC
jgi:hypothetical protein